jgi:hypothetical protein
MAFITGNTSTEVAVFGAVFDDIKDTNPWALCVSQNSLIFPLLSLTWMPRNSWRWFNEFAWREKFELSSSAYSLKRLEEPAREHVDTSAAERLDYVG